MWFIPKGWECVSGKGSKMADDDRSAKKFLRGLYVFGALFLLYTLIVSMRPELGLGQYFR